MLYELMQQDRLESVFSASSSFPAMLRSNFHYVMLGAVSPDYPNLAFGDEKAVLWADAMHFTRASKMITSGIERIRATEEGIVRDKQLAWLMGYCAHVAADVTIHPVVMAKVGPYAENQRQHRICEMNQDSYIYRRMKLGEVWESDSFAQVVLQCSSMADKSCLDNDIVTLWKGMLEDVHPEMYFVNSPDITKWHSQFVARVAATENTDVKLFPLAGLISQKMQLNYPSREKLDFQYLADQMVPLDPPHYLHYDQIFDSAVCNIKALWSLVEESVCSGDLSNVCTFGDWNLDTGTDEHGRLVFW